MENGVQAHMTTRHELIISGTNHWRDMFRYNLHVYEIMSNSSNSYAAVMGINSRHKWHAGFLKYAYRVFSFVRKLSYKPVTVVRHSLGAAAAQIIGSSTAGGYYDF